MLLAVGVALSIVLLALGLKQDSYSKLLFIFTLSSVGGSFTSSVTPKWPTKRSVGAQVIEKPANELERWPVNTASKQAQQAGIGAPEIAIYNAAEINAFAAGMSLNNALAALSIACLKGWVVMKQKSCLVTK